MNLESNGHQPLFLYLPYTSPHFPVEAPVEYLDLYPLVDDTVKRRSYMAMVSHMDNAVGNIVQTLKENGLYDNSIIFVMSDNGAKETHYDTLPFFGGGSNYPLKGQKNTPYEGGCRVPAFIHSPLINHAGECV